MLDIRRHWKDIVPPFILVVILIIPVHYPVDRYAEQATAQSLVLDREHAVEFSLEPSSSKFSGIVFQAQRAPVAPEDTLMHLTVRDDSGNQLRSIETTIGRAYVADSGAVRFTFKPISGTPYTRYQIKLTAPHVDPEQPVLLLQPEALREKESTDEPIVFQTLVTRPVVGALTYYVLNSDREGEDIYYYWQRGGQVAAGDNPYICALDNTCIHRKNPGHLPLFYWLSAGARQVGFEEFDQWMAFWLPVLVAAYLGIAVLLLVSLYPVSPLLAWAGASFWLFNRWSLYVLHVGQIDFIALFFLLLSLLLLPRRRAVAMVLFGLSLAVKQVAVFLLPVYLIYGWYQAKGDWKLLLRDSVGILLIPLAVSLPFMVDHLKAFIHALTFSVTRSSEANFGAPSIDAVLTLTGWPGAVFMGLLFIGVYVLVGRRLISVVTAACLIFIIFLGFNTVIFNQYFIWLLPLVWMVVLEKMLQKKTR
ncbi:MAG: glycosyltransferase family 87 protein [Candidatus Andersenbacteria bacterium]